MLREATRSRAAGRTTADRPAVLRGSSPSRAIRVPPSTKGPLSPRPQKPEGLEPDHGDDAEAVVELGDIDVGGPQFGARPHAGGRVAGGHGGHVVELVPARPAPEGGAHRVHVAGGPRRVAGVVGVGDDEGGRAVTGRIAVEQAERRRDHAGRQVVLHGHGVAVDGVRIEAGVAPGVDGDLPELLGE